MPWMQLEGDSLYISQANFILAYQFRPDGASLNRRPLGVFAGHDEDVCHFVRIFNYLWISFISCLGELTITLEPPNCSGLLCSHVFPLPHLPSITETQLSPGWTWIANHCISILS